MHGQLAAQVKAWDRAHGWLAGPALLSSVEGDRLFISSRTRPGSSATRKVDLHRWSKSLTLRLSGVPGYVHLAPALNSEGECRLVLEGMQLEARQTALVVLKRALF